MRKIQFEQKEKDAPLAARRPVGERHLDTKGETTSQRAPSKGGGGTNP